MADTVVLPAGFKADARYAIMTVAVLGEMLQGICFCVSLTRRVYELTIKQFSGELCAAETNF